MRYSTNMSRRSAGVLELGVILCLVQCFLQNSGVVDGRHISLRRQNRGHHSKERITEDAVMIEAPTPTTTTLLRAGYADHLRQNLKKAFALQLLHQSAEAHSTKSPTSDEFMSKNKANTKLRLYKSLSAKGRRVHVPFFPSVYDGSVPDEGLFVTDDEPNESSASDSEDVEQKFDMAVSHPEEDPHFYQERYETVGGTSNTSPEEDKQEQLGNKGFSLANSYFDNDYSISMLHKMECVTPTKSKGYCSTFRNCVPSLFTSSGELEAPALAELVSMSIGYCSASAPASFDTGRQEDVFSSGLSQSQYQLLKRTGPRYAAVANRIICCPGTPPPPGSSGEENSAEKFNDFLAGSESFLEPDEDDVNHGPGLSHGMSGMGNKQKNVSQTVVADDEEFVQDHPDTEAEVWHSEEDIKAAKNKKPSNIIPIEAFIPVDKLSQYDPHTNTFSKEVFEGEKEQNLLPVEESSSPVEIQTQNPVITQTEDEFMTDNLDHEAPSIANNHPDTAHLPHDDGIASGDSDVTTTPTIDQSVQSTSTPTIGNFSPEIETEESVTITTTTTSISSNADTGHGDTGHGDTGHGENSTFIQISPEPVLGANGKFALDKGVIIEKGTNQRPPPNPANQVNIAQSPVNIIKAGETMVDSNQVVLLRPEQKPEESRPDVELSSSSQSIEIVQLSNRDKTQEVQAPENLQYDETTTDAYNKYHLQQNEESGLTTDSPSYTTNDQNEVQTEDQQEHDKPDYSEFDNSIAKQHVTTIIPERDSLSDDDMPDTPQVITTEYPKTTEVDSSTSHNDIVGEEAIHEGTTNEFQHDDQFPGNRITNSNTDQSSGESTIFVPQTTSATDFASTNSINEESPGTSEAGIKIPDDPAFNDASSNDLSPSNANPQTTPNPEPTGNSFDYSTKFQEISTETPINLLFPIDAATLSPQNDKDSSENRLPSQSTVQVLNESTQPANGVNSGSKETPENNEASHPEERTTIAPSPTKPTLETGNTFESTKIKETSYTHQKEKQKEKVPTTPSPAPSEAEPEFGGLGPSNGLVEGPEYQVLSACASQDYYRSLEEDTHRQYPYLATIVGGTRPFCSGTLITDRHILTASHFLSNITVADVFHMRVHVGYKTTFSGETEGPFAVRKVLKVIRHKGFSFDKLLNDVAILLLDRPVRFSENVHPVCLSNRPQLYSGGGTTAFETGWVEDPLMKKISPHHPFIDPHVLKYFSFGYKNVTWTLQQSSARVKAKEDCQSQYQFLEKSGIYISDSMVCAATEDGKSCSFRGNSGAPLFINRDGKDVQIGLVSWGIGCGHFPAVFTSTSKYLPWIDKVIQRTR